MKFAPIVVFSYNRPHYLKQTLQALSENEESKESTLYIYCDGPKAGASDSEIKRIIDAKAVAKETKWCKNVHIIESETNKGLSSAIISGLNELFENHDRLIVLEDDLVTSPYFLNYMNNALTKYEQNNEVISIVGYNYPLKFNDVDKETYFLKNADCLGWGTWKRGWDLFEEDANILIDKIESKNLIKEFNFNNKYPYMKMLKAVASGTVNSWAIRWYGSAFVNNRLTLFPKKSLVRHIGNVGSNIKADNSDVFGWQISMKPVYFFEKELKENKENRDKLSKHFRKYNRRRLSISSIKYALDRIFNIKLSS